MMRKNTLLFASIILLAACAQEPVEIVYKGGNHYSYKGVKPVQEYSKTAPALVIAKRQSPDRIFVTDNMSVEPVKNEQEFRRVVDAIKLESAKAKTPITVVAIPVEKPSIAQEAQEGIIAYGERGLNSVTPIAKPTPPQWYAQRDNSANVVEGFIWPLRGKIISTFGGKKNGLVNDGINIAAPNGKPIKAAADGEIVYAGNELAGYGNMLIIRHNNGWASAYAHTQKLRVGLGAKVAQGQIIAEVGETGDVSKSQLHFGLRKDKQAVNPMDFLTDNIAANY